MNLSLNKGGRRMNREVLIKILINLDGSIGPDTSMEDMENFEKLYCDAFESMDEGALDIMLEILINPPKTLDTFEYALTKAIAYIGQKDVDGCLQKIRPLLYVEKSRPIIIDAIGGLNCSKGISLLEELLKNAPLNNDDKIRAVDSLTEIGGEEAINLLRKMKAEEILPEVLEEIEICLNILGL